MTNAYAVAIANTNRQFIARTRLYRNLVIAVSLTGITAIGAALVLRSAVPLTLLLFLGPVCGAFFVADRRCLNRWRAQVLADWGAGALELRALTEALSANPAWPRETLLGMLASLPAGGKPVDERGITQATRQAVISNILAADAAATRALGVKTVGWALVSLLCLVAAIAH